MTWRHIRKYIESFLHHVRRLEWALYLEVDAHEAGPIREEIRNHMTEHKSFRISDFSLRDLPWAVTAYLLLSLFSIGLGLFLESLPGFWSGLLLGAGGALLVAFLLLGPGKKNPASGRFKD